MANLSRYGAKSGRGGTLDVLRFAAAFFVVLFHYSDEAPAPLEQIAPVFGRGHLATDFFLMLSGYVLGRAYGRPIEEGRVAPLEFLTRRVARIWPAHVVVLVMLIGFVAAAHLAGFDPHHTDRFRWSDLPAQFFLVQAWGDVGGWGWNLPSWSLSALVVCYALFPFVWAKLVGVRLSTAIVTAIAVIAGLDTLLHMVLERGLFDLPFNMGVVRALPLFFAGMVLAQIVGRAPVARPAAIFGGLTAGGALIAVQAAGRYDAISVSLIAICVLCAGSVPVERPIPGAEAAGKLSFSLFITHLLVANVWFGAAHAAHLEQAPAPVRWLAWAGALPAAVGFALLFDRAIDQPVQKRLTPLLDRAFARRRSQAVAVNPG